VEPAYIVFDGKSGGEFAFGCVTGGLHCRAIFLKLSPASARGLVHLIVTFPGKLDARGRFPSLPGEIRFHKGDDSTFKARRW
jgi:hypothetical protein